MALTLSGTNGVVGAGFTLDASGASVTAGVGTFGSVASSGAISGTTGTFSGNIVSSGEIQSATRFESASGNDLRLNAGSANRDVFLQVNDTTHCTVQGSTGNLQFNSGFGSVSTAYGCRAWIQLNQAGSQSITGSGGVSSITDENTGTTKITFTTAMPDDNWAMVGGAQQSGQSNVNYGFSLCMQSYTTTYGILIYRPSASSDTKEDNSKIHVAFFR